LKQISISALRDVIYCRQRNHFKDASENAGQMKSCRTWDQYMPSLKQRITKLEGDPAYNWLGYFAGLSVEELDKIAGENCMGVPWEEFTDEELADMAEGDASPIEQARTRYLMHDRK
jgi:hypothetical protein